MRSIASLLPLALLGILLRPVQAGEDTKTAQAEAQAWEKYKSLCEPGKDEQRTELVNEIARDFPSSSVLKDVRWWEAHWLCARWAARRGYAEVLGRAAKAASEAAAKSTDPSFRAKATADMERLLRGRDRYITALPIEAAVTALSYAPSRRFSGQDMQTIWGRYRAQEDRLSQVRTELNGDTYQLLDRRLLDAINADIEPSMFCENIRWGDSETEVHNMDEARKLLERDFHHLTKIDRITLGTHSRSDIENAVNRSIPMLAKLAVSANGSGSRRWYRSLLPDWKQAVAASKTMER